MCFIRLSDEVRVTACVPPLPLRTGRRGHHHASYGDRPFGATEGRQSPRTLHQGGAAQEKLGKKSGSGKMRWMFEGSGVWKGWRGRMDVGRAEVGARRAGRQVRKTGGWRRWDEGLRQG